MEPLSGASPFPPSPSKFHTHFLLKATIAVIVVVAIPFFPSQAPDFINQTLNTRSWEVLQLILVAIAVSYGLLSKRSDDTDYTSEFGSKSDNVHSSANRFLRVPSVFGDETEIDSFPGDKIQTWSPPPFVENRETSVLDEQSVLRQPYVKIPSFLPVRSLKSGVLDFDSNESIFRTAHVGGSGSDSGSTTFSSDVESEKLGFSYSEENNIPQSQISRQSRSGMVEREEISDDTFSSMLSSRENHQLESSPRNDTVSGSPSRPSSSATLERHVDDQMKKKTRKKNSSSPVATPIEVPSSSHLHQQSQPEKELKRSVRSVPSGRKREEMMTMMSRSHSGSGLIEPGRRTDGTLVGKSVRTIRPGESAKMEKGDGREDGEFPWYKTGRIDRCNRTSMESERKKRKSTKPTSEKAAMRACDDDLRETGSDRLRERSRNREPEGVLIGCRDGGPDVDKKADEFIAKFREQIRLQRMAS